MPSEILSRWDSGPAGLDSDNKERKREREREKNKEIEKESGMITTRLINNNPMG